MLTPRLNSGCICLGMITHFQSKSYFFLILANSDIIYRGRISSTFLVSKIKKHLMLAIFTDFCTFVCIIVSQKLWLAVQLNLKKTLNINFKSCLLFRALDIGFQSYRLTSALCMRVCIQINIERYTHTNTVNKLLFSLSFHYTSFHS